MLKPTKISEISDSANGVEREVVGLRKNKNCSVEALHFLHHEIVMKARNKKHIGDNLLFFTRIFILYRMQGRTKKWNNQIFVAFTN